jgi:tRNA-Thr(GGU) m(6)t(6)A37 methyltransferase TsaA
MAVQDIALVLACGLALCARGLGAEEPKPFFKVFPVGTVEKKAGAVRLRIAEEYAKALKGLDGFSHVAVLYWFDRNDTPAKRRILQVHPRGNRENPLTGVFACRAPVRPNLIALSVCRILSVEGSAVRVDKIDAFDGTPILDLKPHIPAIDSPTRVSLPDWLRK